MKSPFPGMDPYMERRWGTTHGSLIVYAQEQLNLLLAGTGLRAESQERLVVESDGERTRFIEPDLDVFDRPPPRAADSGGADSGGTATAVAPATIVRPMRLVDDEPITQSFLEIRNYRSGGAVVTVVEFVSPTNKRAGDGRDQFLQKRKERFEAGVNFVEVDLTREGRRHLPGRVSSFMPARDSTYLAFVRRFNPERHWEVYPMPLREPLQPIALPLRRGDADVVLHLQPLIDRAHAAAAFEPFDYAGELHPPLRGDDADWAAERLAEAKVG